MKFILTLATLLFISSSILAQTPEELAQQQLDAYNNRDIEAFLVPYSDTVKIYDFPKVISMQGKEAMRETYSGMFDRIPELNCELKNRIVSGNTVIDHERIFIQASQPKIEAIAIYKMANGKIQEVYFMSPEQYQQ